jgi:hypothetical protein
MKRMIAVITPEQIGEITQEAMIELTPLQPNRTEVK